MPACLNTWTGQCEDDSPAHPPLSIHSGMQISSYLKFYAEWMPLKTYLQEPSTSQPTAKIGKLKTQSVKDFVECMHVRLRICPQRLCLMD
jgi:hypothetical protein